jgi:3-oxoacyl-[acyl-carrier-protein] synthase-3
MAKGILRNCRITGVSCAVPRKKKRPEDYIDVIGNDAVKKFIETVGVKEWRVCDGKMMTSDLCCAAAEKLITELGVDRATIDALIFVSQTPDYVAPSTACVLQHRLGLSQDCMAFDINLACSGYVYGLVNAMAHMQGQGLRRVLLLAGDAVSYHCSPRDRGLMMLAGDAGTATMTEYSDQAADACYLLNTIGSGFKSLIVPCGGYKHRFGEQQRTEREPGIIRSDYDGYMDGAEVFKFSIMEVPKLFRRFYELYGCNETSFDMVFLHQANLFIMKNIAKRLKIPAEKMAVSIDRYANTGAATIPLTMCDFYAGRGKVERGTNQQVALAGFGIGLSLGIVSLHIDPSVCLPIFETDLTFDDKIDSLHQGGGSFIKI